jgi:hypothetical protein
MISNNPVHTFHIPVMGVAYTIDTPVKIAHMGIDSVISIIGDSLIEKMRAHYYAQINEPYLPIAKNEKDFRARRIADYLNLVQQMVQREFEKIKELPFIPGTPVCTYFEMLSDWQPLKKLYSEMLAEKKPELKETMQKALREKMYRGRIDVNIMTKIDKNNLDASGNVLEDGSDAVAALRGYAMSTLMHSAVVFSAGMNPRLYNYLERWEDFSFRDGGFRKMVIIKVSDYRSALIQGKYLAKRAIWVSEFRIESGLNCGGHAFATDGYLMGPILEEFKNKRQELIAEIFELFVAASKLKGKEVPSEAPPMKITAQGGIGSFEEDQLLLNYYGIEGTGWGTPFLLCPEVTNVEENTLKLLCAASEKEVTLSKNSPLGVPFNYLHGTSSGLEKKERILNGKPGSPCTEKNLISNTEFTETAICAASLKYQRLKIKSLEQQNLSEAALNNQKEKVLTKECLCVGLSNSALVNYKAGPITGNSLAVSICPGPNIAYFNKVASLKEMTDHIYGRASLLVQSYRPHFFIKELFLYVDYLKEMLLDDVEITAGWKKQVALFGQNLISGIDYYRQAYDKFIKTGALSISQINHELDLAERQVEEMIKQFEIRIA